jgi:hypothetical protein
MLRDFDDVEDRREGIQSIALGNEGRDRCYNLALPVVAEAVETLTVLAARRPQAHALWPLNRSMPK